MLFISVVSMRSRQPNSMPTRRLLRSFKWLTPWLLPSFNISTDVLPFQLPLKVLGSILSCPCVTIRLGSSWILLHHACLYGQFCILVKNTINYISQPGMYINACTYEKSVQVSQNWVSRQYAEDTFLRYFASITVPPCITVSWNCVLAFTTVAMVWSVHMHRSTIGEGWNLDKSADHRFDHAFFWVAANRVPKHNYLHHSL